MYCWKPPPSDAIVVGCTAIGVTTSVSLLRRNGTTCTSIVADSIGEGDHAVTHDPMLWQKKKEQWQRTNKSKNRSIHVRNLVFQFFGQGRATGFKQLLVSPTQPKATFRCGQKNGSVLPVNIKWFNWSNRLFKEVEAEVMESHFKYVGN